MLIIPPVQYRKRPAKPKKAVAGPPPALALVSAVYSPGNQTLTLGFNRAIDASNYDGSNVEVDDGDFHQRSYLAIGDVTVLDANTIQVPLAMIYSDNDPGVFLSAADTGIIAGDDGSAWDGCENLALPFGE